MRRYHRLVMIWLALGFGVVLVLMGLAGHPLDLDSVRDPERMRVLAVRMGLGWLLFGLVFGGLSYALRKKRAHVGLVEGFGGLVNTALLILILGCLLKLGFELVPDFDKLSAATQLDRFFRPVWVFIGAVASKLGASDKLASGLAPPLIFVVLAMIGRIAVNWGVTEIAVPEAGDPSLAVGPPRAGREEDPEAVRRREAATRRVAVASYTEAKALLQTTEMELTFLSLDVVGSTRMKQGEDAYVIEQAFSDYRSLVERQLRRHEAYKQTWTPDGQMAAFKSPQAALECAQGILNALPEFNRKTSRMRTDFQVRAGANTGVVSTDDDTPMERMSDFTIDVAGHMQKYADPDALWMSEASFERLTDKTGVEANGQEVDGRKVYVWKRSD
jgi:class 3 adenylate cyclase